VETKIAYSDRRIAILLLVQVILCIILVVIVGSFNTQRILMSNWKAKVARASPVWRGSWVPLHCRNWRRLARRHLFVFNAPDPQQAASLVVVCSALLLLALLDILTGPGPLFPACADQCKLAAGLGSTLMLKCCGCWDAADKQ